MPAVVNATGGPYAAGSTPVYTAQLLDENNVPLGGNSLTTMTLTIVDTITQQIINGVDRVDVLNTGRGTVDALGNITIALTAGDTSMSETTALQVQRSMIIDYTYNAGAAGNRHQVNFLL